MLETFKRINLDKVADAFTLAGIEPVRGCMSGCVMGAICSPKNKFIDFVDAGFDKDYLFGVMDGWDHHDTEKSAWEQFANFNSLQYKVGRADGSAAWRIIQGV